MRILILGANGMIGHRVLVEARTQFGKEVYGLIRKRKCEFETYNFLQENIFDQTDITDWNGVLKILDELKPDVIVNAIGVTIRRVNIADLNYVLEVNSFFPNRLKKWVQKNNSRLIHLSTDCVFNGDVGSYTEFSTPTAIDNYGRTKFLGEVEGENVLTLRFSCIGQELDARSELLEWFLSNTGKTIKGYSNAIYSGVTTLVIAQEICKLIKDFKELIGLFQLSGQRISKYDLLILANDHFKTKTNIEKSTDFKTDKTLVSTKYQKITGYIPKDWNEMMQELALDTKVIYKR